MIDKMVHLCYHLEVDGGSDSVVVLQEPPLFSGARIVVSAFHQATGQLNVSFEGLSAEAKQLLDLHASQKLLEETLKEKGYILQMVTVTTELIDGRTPLPEQGKREHGHGKQQQRHHHKEEPEE